jgi:hypothetical protein
MYLHRYHLRRFSLGDTRSPRKLGGSNAYGIDRALRLIKITHPSLSQVVSYSSSRLQQPSLKAILHFPRRPAHHATQVRVSHRPGIENRLFRSRSLFASC